jgi:hypothetical protein
MIIKIVVWRCGDRNIERKWEMVMEPWHCTYVDLREECYRLYASLQRYALSSALKAGR